ncbi:MAG: protoporphyrinogen oxidase HemJ [Pseudomonadota bacterium]
MATFLAGGYLWFKALHILSVIAWMAAMMYLPRLFIYHFQAEKGGEAEQLFVAMERRLLKGIMTPAMIATWVFALLMVAAQPGLFAAGWFHAKVLLAFAISGIHGFYIVAQRDFESGVRPRSQKFWRLMNEAPFLLLIGIVLLVVLKPF